ncbi:hypothetical protein OIU84_001680 [Salix udensis]|uniref:Uncharacterized protein n=1 Tax=Salix udensis TaxID=889485 RepID=A0AAD6K7P7_9ROSI|nr:hypothetical protein OIU84_001680 [Salix udensis]
MTSVKTPNGLVVFKYLLDYNLCTGNLDQKKSTGINRTDGTATSISYFGLSVTVFLWLGRQHLPWQGPLLPW